MMQDNRITPGNRAREALVRWADRSALGQRVAYWIGRTAGGIQLHLKIKGEADIPWMPLKKPLAQAIVALVTTGGVHLCTDQPFNLSSDASFRVIPRAATSDVLCISHDHYDRRDAARDINLVFPLERLLELEQEGVIGHTADMHYGFGFVKNPLELIAPGRKVGALLAQAGVDLVVLVPG